MTGWIALVVAVAVAAVTATWWRARQGRLTGGRDAPVPLHAWADLGVELGDRATLVQFSSAFCQPCRVTRGVLATVAGQLEGVSHHEVDAESHLTAVRSLDIRKTPTTLVLDGAGREIARAAGVPRRDQVVALLTGSSAGEVRNPR